MDKRFFVGLQSPLAAGVITFLPWVGYKYGLEVTPLVAYLCAILTVFIGFLMISNYSYSSFKELQFKGTVPYMVFVFVVIMLVVVAQNPHEVLLIMAVAYALSGPIMWLYKKQAAQATPPEVPASAPAKKALSSKKAQTVKPQAEKAKASKDEEGK